MKPKFELGQRVRVVNKNIEPFCGIIEMIIPPEPPYYRVEARENGHTYAMTVEESWLELEEPEAVRREAHIPTLDTGALAKSLKNLCFFLGGSHVAGLVEEAERAAWKGMVVKYE